MVNIKRYCQFFLFLTPVLLSAQGVFAQVQDPTRPTGYVGDGTPWQLNAIIISPDRRIAIIGGISVKVGDEISGEKVIAIEAGSVTLEGSNGRMVLYLLEKSIKHVSE